MIRILFFLCFAFFSHVVVAGNLEFEIHWFSSEEANSSGIQAGPNLAFVHLNKKPIYFNTVQSSVRYKHDGRSVAHSVSLGSGSGSFLEVGTNVLSFSYVIENTTHLTAGWQESALYQRINGSLQEICRSRIAAGQQARGSCKSQFQKTLEELNPRLAREIWELQRDIQSLIKYADVDAFQERFALAEALLQEVAVKNFSELTEEQFASFQSARDAVSSLKKDIKELERDIQKTQSQIRQNLVGKKAIIAEELKREGVDDTSDVAQPTFQFSSRFYSGCSGEGTCEAGGNFGPQGSIYQDYADQVLAKLRSAINGNERLGFLAEVKIWTQQVVTLERIALERERFSMNEWEAYQSAYHTVSDFVDQHVDQDLWFKDSPVPVEVRKAFKEELAEVAPAESSDLESALKRLSSKNLTEQERRGIELVQALVFVGKELAKSARNAYEAVQEFKGFLKETTDTIARGTKCLSQAQVSGRIGSLYELFSGKDQCDGSELSFVGRTMAGVEIALGTPKVFKILGSVVGIGILAKGNKAADVVKASNVVVDSLKKFDIAADQTKNFLATLKKFKIDPAAVKFPERISFNKNLKNHMKSFDGLAQKTGIKGAHNMKDFEALVDTKGIKIVKKTETPTKGIYEIEYEIQKLDKAGKPSGEMKAIDVPKTVYDPAVFSDDEMLWLGQIAASDAKKFNAEGRKLFESTAGGISFRVYSENGLITNIHPIKG